MKNIKNSALDGLYVGMSKEFAVTYVFKSLGKVVKGAGSLLGFTRFVDPDIMGGWRTIRRRWEPFPEELPEGDFFKVKSGLYELLENRIRFRTIEVSMDIEQQLVLFDELFKDDWEHYLVEENSFSILEDFDLIEINGIVLARQQDQTGKKLEGEFTCFWWTGFSSGHVKGNFTLDGQFYWEDSSLIGAPIKGHYGLLPPSEGKGTGRYEIRGHEIILYYSNGWVERKLFAYLGENRGKKYVAIGNLILNG